MSPISGRCQPPGDMPPWLTTPLLCVTPTPALPGGGRSPPPPHEGSHRLLLALRGGHPRPDRPGESFGGACVCDTMVTSPGHIIFTPTPVFFPQVHEEFKQNVENIGTDMLLRRFAESKGTGRERPGELLGQHPGGSSPPPTFARGCRALSSHEGRALVRGGGTTPSCEDGAATLPLLGARSVGFRRVPAGPSAGRQVRLHPAAPC